MKKKRQQKQREKRLYYCKLQLKNVQWTWRKPFTFRFTVTNTHTHTRTHTHPHASRKSHSHNIKMLLTCQSSCCAYSVRERGRECELTSKAKDWWQRFSFSFGRGQSSHCVYAKVKHDENAPRCLIKNALRAVWSCIQHRGTNTRKHRGTNTHTGSHWHTHRAIQKHSYIKHTPLCATFYLSFINAAKKGISHSSNSWWVHATAIDELSRKLTKLFRTGHNGKKVSCVCLIVRCQPWRRLRCLRFLHFVLLSEKRAKNYSYNAVSSHYPGFPSPYSVSLPHSPCSWTQLINSSSSSYAQPAVSSWIIWVTRRQLVSPLHCCCFCRCCCCCCGSPFFIVGMRQRHFSSMPHLLLQPSPGQPACLNAFKTERRHN